VERLKVRNGFVSNSSSSSFVIRKKYLEEEMISKIKNHIEEGKKLEISFASKDDEWDIIETNEFIKGSTFMDNFNMWEYLHQIGIDSGEIKWDGDFEMPEEDPKKPIVIDDAKLLRKLLSVIDPDRLSSSEVMSLLGIEMSIQEILK